MAPRKQPEQTALALAKPEPFREVVIEDPHGMIPSSVPIGQLGELATVGSLGLSEVKLTDAEEAVLARPVNPADILLKPDGIAYLPHIVYTRWFNEAFGRTGWAIVPTAKPAKGGKTVIVPYMLYIHGKPVAFAIGEQDYHEENKRQTYGDAIESTVASALRRCAKRLGVGLEMWDKNYLASIGKPQARPVSSQLENQQPFTPSSTAKITPEQRQRLGSIAKRVGRKPAEISAWLKERYGVGSSAGLFQSQYTEVVTALEAKGPLPMRGDGPQT